MKTKLTALLLLAALLLALISGCSSEPAPSPTTDSSDSSVSDPAEPAETPDSTTPAEDSAEKPAAGVPALPLAEGDPEVSFWMSWADVLAKYWPTANDTLFPTHIHDATGVWMRFECASASAATEQYNLMMVAQDYPDIIAGMSTYNSQGGDYAIEEGIIHQLNDYVEQFMPNYQAARAWGDEQTRGTVTDAGNMAYIYSLVKEPEAAFMGLAIRKDLLDAQGLAMPVTVDDWHTALTTLKSAYGTAGPLRIPKNGIYTNSEWATAYGIGTQWYQVDGEVKYGALEEGYKQYLSLLSQWYAEGLIDKDFTSNNDLYANNNDAVMEEEVVAGSILWGYGGNNFYTRGMSSNPDIFYMGTRHPVLNVGDETHLCQYSSSVLTAFGITSNARDPELCCRLLDYFYTDEGSMLLDYGVEGEQWERDESGNVVMTQTFLDAVAASDKENPWESELRNHAWWYSAPGIYHYERLLLQYDDLTTYNSTCVIWNQNDHSWAYPTLATMTADENETYSRVYADASTIIEEYTCNIIVGNADLSAWDEMVAAVNSVGFDQCIAIKQAALDRYNAR